eukprot:4628547-Prymnesium_polylepis.1
MSWMRRSGGDGGAASCTLRPSSRGAGKAGGARAPGWSFNAWAGSTATSSAPEAEGPDGVQVRCWRKCWRRGTTLIMKG